MDHNSKEFKDLNAKWAKKLAQSGFEDIEQDETYLHNYSSRDYRNGSAGAEKVLYFSAKQDYYALAGQFYHDHKFDNKTEKAIWNLHSQGVGIRGISKIAKTRKYKGYVERDSIHRIIKRLATIMLENAKKTLEDENE